MKAASAHTLAVAAKHASRVISTLSADARNAALESIAQQLEAQRKIVLAANEDDLRRVDADKLEPATRARLVMSAARLDEMVAQVRAVAALPDPLGRELDAVELDDASPGGAADGMASGTRIPFGNDKKKKAETKPGAKQEATQDATRGGLRLQKISVPLGVLAVIFEARPDAVTQIAALAIKSGNAALLKPGGEVERTAAALIDVVRGALAAAGLPEDAITVVRGRARAAALLREDALIDMVIPRGSKALIDYVQAHTRIPVLGHAEGVCHIYVDRAADETMALRVIEDAKCDYPAACNAVETVLVHRDIAKKFLPKLARRLAKLKVVTHYCEPSRELLLAAELGEQKGVANWHHEYGALGISVGIVESMDAAIAHIHRHGSSHTESIVTEDAVAAEKFLREVDAAGVFHNASTRFADGFRYGFGAEVGVSTSKFHARGPVGLDGLTTYKYVLRGNGHVAAAYRGAGARAFTHRRTR